MSTQVNFRMDKDVKVEMEEILRDLGMTASIAFNLFAHAVIRERGIPFSLKLADAENVEDNEVDLENKIEE